MQGRWSVARLCAYGLGFALSITLTFLVAGLAGSLVQGLAGSDTRITIYGLLLAGLVILDLLWWLSRKDGSVGLTRQTPWRWTRYKGGPFYWGLDTGIPFTTVRETILPLAGLAAVVLGLSNWLVGSFYAIGYLSALLLLSTAPSSWLRGGHDPIALNRALARARFGPRSISLVVGALTSTLLLAVK